MNVHPTPIRRARHGLRDLSIVKSGDVSSYVLDAPEGHEKRLPHWEVRELRAEVGAWTAEFQRLGMPLLGNSRQRKVQGKELSREKQIESFVLAKAGAKGATGGVRCYWSCEQVWNILCLDFLNIISFKDNLQHAGKEPYYEMSPSERIVNPLSFIPEDFSRERDYDLKAFLRQENLDRTAELEVR